MFHALLILLLLLPCTSPAQTTSRADPGLTVRLEKLGKRAIRVHDPSTIIRDHNEWWLFYTGRGVPSFHSKDLLNWTSGPAVFTNAPPWITNAVPENRGMYYWAPDIIKPADRFLLYYSVSSFGKNHSVIALASNSTLDPSSPKYEWRDDGTVISSELTNNFNAIDPAVTKAHDGRVWLSFGSFWSGIKLVELDPASGKRIAPDSPLYSLARNQSIEAPYIYFHDGFYYLFVNWGLCCRGTNSTYNIRVGRSPNITGPYLDKSGEDLSKGGGTLLLETDGPFVGPGHAAIFQNADRYWFSMHFYDATDRGASKLAIRSLKWESEGWPRILQSE